MRKMFSELGGQSMKFIFVTDKDGAVKAINLNSVAYIHFDMGGNFAVFHIGDRERIYVRCSMKDIMREFYGVEVLFGTLPEKTSDEHHE